MKITAEDWCDLAVATYAALIADRVHFAQAAYRDGEWYCMLGKAGGNVNGEKYDPALGAMLRRTLLEPVGQWCCFWWKHPSVGTAARKGAIAWLADHQPAVRWLPDRPIGRANQAGKAKPFWSACQSRRVVIVGPEHMRNLTLLDAAEHVVVPSRVAWKHTEDVCQQVLDVHRPDDLVLFAAGMASNLMIHRLWPELKGTATLYDVGAALDPYCGVFSRGSFRTQGWKENVMPRNVP